MKRIVAALFSIFTVAVFSLTVNAFEVDFGELLTAQETEGYEAFKSNAPYEIYQQAKSEIPEKVVLQESVSVDAANVFYVSVDGNDNNDGKSQDKAFATLKKALDEVAALSDAQKEVGVAIYICSGEYLIDEPIKINSSHTGPNGKLFISSYGGEAMLSQSKKAKGSFFKKITKDSIGELTYLRLSDEARKNGYYFDYADAGISEDIPAQSGLMYFSDKEQMLKKARYPDSGYISVGTVIEGGVYGSVRVSPEWIPDDERFLSWGAEQDIYLKGRVSAEWTISDEPITIVGDRIKAGTEVLSHNLPVSPVIMTQTPATYYLYNIIEEMNVQGECYTDNKNKRVYFIPYETPDDDDYIKLNCGNTGVMEISDTQNVVISGLKFDSVCGGIRIEDSEKILVQDSDFSNIDGSGVTMWNTMKCGVINSNFKNIKNGNAVIISTDDYEYYPRRNFVQNSYLYNCETAMTVSSFGSIVSHNVIHKTQDCAIFVGLAENIIEYNEFVSTHPQMVDAGAIYVNGSILDRNNHIRNNYFHDSQPKGYESQNGRGVYLDGTNESNFVYGNVFENLTYGVLMTTGDNHVVVDNVFIDCFYGIANSTIFSVSSTEQERYFDDPYPFFIQNYILYGVKDMQSWKDRNGSLLADKYEDIMEADAKYDAAENKSLLISTDLSIKYLLGFTECYVANNITSGCTTGVFSQTIVEKYFYKNTLKNNSTVSTFDKDSLNYFEIIGATDECEVWKDDESIVLNINSNNIIPEADFSGLSWSEVSGADYYILTVSPNSDLSNPIVDSKMVLSAEHPLTRYVYSSGVVSKENNYSVDLNKKYYVQITARSNAEPPVEKVSDVLEFMVSDNVITEEEEWFKLTHGTISDYVEICGVMDKDVFFEERYITALVFDKDSNVSELMMNPQKIKYIVQIPVDENNEYYYKFKMADFENCNVFMKIGDDQVVTDLDTLDVQKCIDIKFEFNTNNTNGGIAKGDTLQSSAVIDNYFSYVDKYYMVIAIYDRNDKLIDAKLSDEFDAPAGKQTETLEYDVPGEAAYAKAFIMDKNNFAPLFESQKIEN